MKAVRTVTRKKRDITAGGGRRVKHSGNRSLYAPAGLLAGIVFVCYANSLGNEFVFDDHHLVFRYAHPQSFSHLLSLIFDSYRPVRNLSYILDFVIWGEQPFGFHLTNVLLHAANTVMVFLLVRRLAGRAAWPFVASLIFAVHPIQTDAVAYVSGRRDLLFTLFYIAAFHVYLKYRDSRSPADFLLFLLLWALSLMSKEMAVTLPAIVFLWNFCDSWREQSGSWLKRSFDAGRKAFSKDRWLYLGLLAAAAAFVYYAVFVRQASGRVSGGRLEYWGGSFFASALTVLRVHAWYLKQLVFPTPIAQYFGVFDISHTLFDLRVIVSLLLVASLVAGAFISLRKERLAGFAILSYFVILLPVSQIIPHHELAADHYLYLPMVSFSLLVAIVASRLAAEGKQSRNIVYLSVVVAAIVFGVMTVMRNRDWKDELSVWQANYEAVPGSPRAAYNLGGLYLRQWPERAETLLKQAMESDPTFEPTYLTLAQLYLSQKRIAEAEEMIQAGLSLTDAENISHILRNPPLLRSQFTTVLAGVRWEQGDRQETERLLQKAIEYYPLNEAPYEALANIYRATDRSREAAILEQSVAAYPYAYEIRARLASVLIEEKRYDEALNRLRPMLNMTPTTNTCRKAQPYLASARSAVEYSMELRVLRDTLDQVKQKCDR